MLDLEAVRKEAEEKIAKYDIRPPNPRLRTANFSGASANGTSFASLGGLDRIDMVSGSSTKASTGSIDSAGNFSVTWKSS